MIEEATWGKIKYLFSSEFVNDETSISLSLLYPPGEAFWTAVVPDPVTYPGEVWYEKTADYVLTVQAGELTFTNGGPTRALFVVRFTEAGGDSLWQLVTWRDDI